MDLQKAVMSLCKLGNHVREHWHEFVLILGVGSALLVDGSWLLSFASMTTPGTYAEKITDVPSADETAKAKMVANPLKGKDMIAFLSAEVFEGGWDRILL